MSPSDFVGNYHPVAGNIRITDSLIAQAKPFPEWGPCFLGWNKCIWKDPSKGVPCVCPHKNAYHIKYLAEIMEASASWVGPPLNTKGEKVRDGNHRLRAAQYLMNVKKIVISIPTIASWA